MSELETTAKRGATMGDRDPVWSADVVARPAAKSRVRIVPFLLTFAAIAIATPLVWAMWNAYVGAPWTRDGTVRAYVVTMAPEVEGRIVELPVVDNQLTHKSDLLLVIDPPTTRSHSSCRRRQCVRPAPTR